MSDQCIEVFQDLKLKKKYKFIIYSMNKDNTEIVVEKAAESGVYDEFLKALPGDDCRYCIFDLEFEHPEGGQRNKICFIAWYAEIYDYAKC